MLYQCMKARDSRGMSYNIGPCKETHINVAFNNVVACRDAKTDLTAGFSLLGRRGSKFQVRMFAFYAIVHIINTMASFDSLSARTIIWFKDAESLQSRDNHTHPSPASDMLGKSPSSTACPKRIICHLSKSQ